MKTLLLLSAVPVSFAVYFVLVTQGVFQKTAWPHYLVSLIAIGGLVFLISEKATAMRIVALVAAVGLTGAMAWWMFSYAAYDEAPLFENGKTLPLASVPGLVEMVAERETTELVFYRGYW